MNAYRAGLLDIIAAKGKKGSPRARPSFVARLAGF